jgi:hypothetical protein
MSDAGAAPAQATARTGWTKLVSAEIPGGELGGKGADVAEMDEIETRVTRERNVAFRVVSRYLGAAIRLVGCMPGAQIFCRRLLFGSRPYPSSAMKLEKRV